MKKKQSVKEYKMTFAKQTYYSLTMLMGLFLLSVIPLDIAQDTSKSYLFWAYVIFVGVCIALYLPLFILFIKYYSLNKGLVMIYDAESGCITIKNKKLRTETAFTLDDIKYLFYTKSGSGLMAWNNYHYSEIYLENGKKFIITCLMAPQLTLPVGEKYESFTVYYPYPKGF